ncbi:ABC transporter [Pseudonocardiaceae bacterium YIM PH 21723]|nr:ABC transporter [Pseudonocardiaceae bacterium YIM PH 21723]
MTTLLRPLVPLRIIPPGMYARRASSMMERAVLSQRSAWLTFVTGFFEPVFFLFALGYGFGRLVGGIEGVDYAAYLAPALLAISAMNGAIMEATFSIFFRLKYAKLYDAVLATPMGPVDVALGEIGFALVRGAIYSLTFLIVMLAMGLVGPGWALLALVASLLVALAFSAAGMAVATFLRSWQDFDMVMLFVIPMFLFSSTYYPLSVYPEWLQVLIQCFPLYHGIELIRSIALGHPHWGLLWHVAYFAVMTVIGGVIAARRVKGLLLK